MSTIGRNDAFNSDAILAKDNSSVEQKDPFWTHAEIDKFRWNQSYPYQLMLVKRDGDQYLRDSTALKWTFTLPIGPQAISYNMPFGIRAGAQLSGFYEQHGGAPVRYIQLQGTTGVLPLKGSAPSRSTGNFFAGIFAGTIAAAQRATGSLQQKPNVVTDSDFSDDNISKTSGYYQFRKLQEFFENYSAFKKTEAGRDYILALAIWKDQAVYLVTPTNFQVSRTADSPYEYPYTLSFKAWKRVNLQQSGAPVNAFTPVTRDSSRLGKMLQSINESRRTLEAARATILAVGGDIDHSIFEPLRELALWVKDLVGVPLALADLPVQIISDAKQAIITSIGVQYSIQGIPAAFSDASEEIQELFLQIAEIASQTNQSTSEGGLSDGVNVTDGITTTKFAQRVFEDPNSFYEFFSRINVASLTLSPFTIRSIINERDRVRTKTRLDFEQQRDTYVQAMGDFADFVGAGNATYSATFGRPVRATTHTPSTQDFQVIFAMNKTIIELNRLAASGDTNRFQTDSINYVAGLARQAGMAFQIPQSKFAVPYPYGMTLEQLSIRYLNTPDRWIEIASLNGLRAPYVDEVGFDLLLLTNGHDNQVEISDATNLFIGQQVWLSSTTTARTSRRIIKMESLNSGQTILTLDGDPDLGRYSTLAQATLHAFLPDTVNSMMQIYIPSAEDPADQDYRTKSIPGVDYFDPLVEAAGVDLLLTESLDLAITPDGDCRLAVGLANLIQTARIRLSTPQGNLMRHPSFGLAIKPGDSTADVDAQTLLRSCQDLFSDDPTFTGVSSSSVIKQGNSALIAIQIGVRGVSQNIPVSFRLQP
jgi:hypothetical protein